MRKITEQRLQAAKLASKFAGLPPNYTRFQLCDDIADARAQLGLDSDGVCLLHYLIKRTRDEDWSRGAEPLVAWSRFAVCHAMGWSEDKLARVENRICNAGMIAFKDAPNCKRRLVRNENGSIAKSASGISLAPTGTRAIEIMNAAHQRKEEAKQLYSVYGELFSLRSELIGYQSCEEIPADLAERTSHLVNDLPTRRNHDQTLELMRTLRDRAAKFLATIKVFLGITAPKDLAEAVSEQLPTVAQTPNKPESETERLSYSCAAKTKPLHRNFAGHKYPDTKIQRKEHNLVDILMASPEIFRAYLENAQLTSGNRWERALEGAMEQYGSDLSLKPSLLGRMRNEYGVSSTLKALFGLGRMAEKGADIHNPAAYALSLARNANVKSTFAARTC